MSSIADKLVLLNRTKKDIKAAIEEKGQTIGNIAFSQYANRVRAIKGLSPVTPSSASTADVTGKLNCLNGTKADIKTAIEACGVPVGSIPFSQYADKIRAIQTKPIYELRPYYEWQDERGDSLGNITSSEYISDKVYIIDTGFSYVYDGDDITLFFDKIELVTVDSTGRVLGTDAELKYDDLQFSFDESYKYNCDVDVYKTYSEYKYYIAFRKNDTQVPMQWDGDIWITDKNTGAKIKIMLGLLN